MRRTLPTTALRVVLLLVVSAGALRAQPAAPSDSAARHLRAAERLIEISRMESLMEGQAETMLRQQMEAMPELAPFEDILRSFYEKQMSFERMRTDVLQLYVATFSERDLNDMADFYQTDLGQRMLVKMPELMTRVVALSQRHLQEAMPELMAAIEVRARELQALADPAEPRPDAP